MALFQRATNWRADRVRPRILGSRGPPQPVSGENPSERLHGADGQPRSSASDGDARGNERVGARLVLRTARSRHRHRVTPRHPSGVGETAPARRLAPARSRRRQAESTRSPTWRLSSVRRRGSCGPCCSPPRPPRSVSRTSSDSSANVSPSASSHRPSCQSRASHRGGPR